MVGYTVGNADKGLVAILCQNNIYHSLLDNTTKSLLVVGVSYYHHCF